MMLPPPPGPHFSAAELLHICRARELLAADTEARAIHHLAVLCEPCWSALDELPVLEYCSPYTATGSAVARLAAPPASYPALRPNHRAAIAAAPIEPLGFCRLLVEESWWAALHDLRIGLRDLLPRTYGLVLGNGACLDAPREAHDLQAYLLALFAHGYSATGDPSRAREAVALAKAHLARGKGGAEPKATLLEVEAQLAAWDDKPGSTCLLLAEARQLVEGYEPADREAELVVLEGIAIAGYREGSRPRAATTLRKGVTILDRLAPGTNPSLRLQLTHELAIVEADNLLYNRVLGQAPEGPDAAAIGRMVADLEPLYQRYGGPVQAAQRAAILGKILVFSDPEKAQAAFRQAMADYWHLRNRPAAGKLLRHLLYLWARADVCKIRGVDLGFLLGIWDLPLHEAFFYQLMEDVEAAVAAQVPPVTIDDQVRQLRRAVRARSRKAATGR